MTATFVGRENELASLTALCRTAVADEVCASAVIVGAPGSGKTRLVTEILTMLPDVEQVRVNGYELERGIALAATRELLRRLGERSGEAVDALAFGITDGSTPAEPIRLFEAAHRALDLSGPTLIAIDDLQWVDDLSVALLHYLLRAAVMGQRPLVLVVASRPDPAAVALRTSLRTMLDADRMRSIDLGPLARPEGIRLVRGVAPQLDDARADALWEAADGSPFWLELLARSTDSGLDPASVVADRLQAISADESALLAVLTVAGRPLSVDDVAGVQAWPRERIESAASLLERRGLVRRGVETVAVAHELIGNAVARQITTEHAMRLHDRIGTWIEGVAGHDAQLLLQALEHRSRGGQPVGALALRLARSPRLRLLGRQGFERLAGIADEAISSEPGCGELAAAVASVASELGLHDDALRRWSAQALVVDHPLDRTRAELRASEEAVILARAGEARDHLDSARRWASDDAAITVEILAQEAALLQFLEHRPRESREVADRAVAATRQFITEHPRRDDIADDTRRAVLRALAMGLQAVMFADEPEVMLQLADEIVGAAAGFDDPTRLRALVDGALAMRFLGRNVEAESRLRNAWLETNRLVIPEVTLEAGAALAAVVLSMARIDQAVDVVNECVALDSRLSGFRAGRAFLIVVPHLVELSHGDWRAAVEGLARSAADEAEPHYRQHALREHATALSRLDPVRAAKEIADSVASALADSALTGCRRCFNEATCRGVEALARIGRTDGTESLLDGVAIPAADVQNRFWLQRARTAITATTADHGTTISELHDLDDAAGRLDLHLESLWIRLDLARTLADVDRHAAIAILHHVADAAQQAGAQTESRLAEHRLRSLGVRAWRRAGSTSGRDAFAQLTTREREIAGLIAGGASNPEIADAVFLSRKTVERHVSNIFAKIGVRNRAELAALVTEEAGRLPR